MKGVRWNDIGKIKPVVTIEDGVTVSRINGQVVARVDLRSPVPTPNPCRKSGMKHRIRKQEIADHLGIPVDQLEIVE